MGITHHSNYIRWMEEARVDFLKRIGWDFARLESLGISSPVVSVGCSYKAPTYFEDEIEIMVSVSEIRGVKLTIGYVMKNAEEKTVCEGSSVHAFFGSSGRPLRLSADMPDFCEAMLAASETGNKQS